MAANKEMKQVHLTSTAGGKNSMLISKHRAYDHFTPKEVVFSDSDNYTNAIFVGVVNWITAKPLHKNQQSQLTEIIKDLNIIRWKRCIVEKV